MSHKLLSILIFLMLSFTFVFCKKEAGFGGKSKIMINVFQGEEAVPGAVVYVAFGDTVARDTLPAYDFVDTADYSGKLNVQYLTRGKYYFYTEYPGVVDTISTTFRGGYKLMVTNKHSEYHVALDCKPDL